MNNNTRVAWIYMKENSPYRCRATVGVFQWKIERDVYAKGTVGKVFQGNWSCALKMRSVVTALREYHFNMIFRKYPPVRMDSTGKIVGEVKCVGCGYDLRGRRLEERCPECGELVRTTEETIVQANLMRWSRSDFVIAYSAVGGVCLSIVLTVLMVLSVLDMSLWSRIHIMFWVAGASWGGSILLSLILMGVNGRRVSAAPVMDRILTVTALLSLAGALLFSCCGYSVAVP